MNGFQQAIATRSFPVRARRAIRAFAPSSRLHYERERMLWRQVPLGLGQLPSGEPARTQAIVLLLAKALRAERALGRAGHWTYDLNRHLGLLQAYKAERATLKRDSPRAAPLGEAVAPR